MISKHLEAWCDRHEVDIVTIPDIAQDSFIAVGRGDCAVGLTPEEAAEKLAARLEIPRPVPEPKPEPVPEPETKPDPEPVPTGHEVELVGGPFCGLKIGWFQGATKVGLRGVGQFAATGVHSYRLEDGRKTAIYIGLEGGAK